MDGDGMMTRLFWIAPLAALALTGCKDYGESRTPVIKAPAAKVVGEPENCISLGSMQSSNVHDDYTIDFRVGSKTYRNTLPYQCHSLGFEKAFSYATSLSQLCNTDIIYVLRTGAGRLERGAGCGLGMFVPIEYEKKDSQAD